jgi:hypothetical protein
VAAVMLAERISAQQTESERQIEILFESLLSQVFEMA